MKASTDPIALLMRRPLWILLFSLLAGLSLPAAELLPHRGPTLLADPLPKLRR